MRYNEFRSSDDACGVRLFYLCNKETGAKRAVLTAIVDTVRTCIFGLDEGAIGTAGVAAAAFQQKATVWARFDNTHRIIRVQDTCGEPLL